MSPLSPGRTPVVLLAVGLATLFTACRSETVHLQDRTNLWARTRGVVVHERGALVHAAMLDTTCEFDAESGLLTGDWDMPTADERIADSYRGAVLGTSSSGLHLVASTAPDRNLDWDAVGVLGARLADDGVVSVEKDGESCSLRWRGRLSRTVPLPLEVCESFESLAVERTGETAFVATGSDLWRITEGGVVDSLGISSRYLRWHAPADAVVSADDIDVSLVDATGEVLWRHTMSATVQSIGVLASDYVGVRADDGLTALSSTTGDEYATTNDLVPPGEMITSNLGDLVAFVSSDIVAVRKVSCGSLSPEDPEEDPANLLD